MLKYLASIFDSAQSTSFSRIATAMTTLVGCVCVLHTTFHSHTLPDAGSLLGMGGFMVAPYGLNKVAGMVAGKGAGSVPSITAVAGEELTPEETRAVARAHLNLGRILFLLLILWFLVVAAIKIVKS